MDQQLILGVLLIVVGIALGLIAAAVVVNRRIDAREANEAGRAHAPTDSTEPAKEANDQKETDAEAVSAEESAAEMKDAETKADEQRAADAEDAQPDAGEQPAAETEDAAWEPGDVPDTETVHDNEPGASEPGAPPSSDSLLGELHRDPVTGALLVKSGGREFRSASDINDRAQRERLAGAAAELSAWFEQSSSVAGQSAATGMVQAIDQILQRSLEQLDSSSRGVRLIQDISGGVKVLIGVKSYEVDEVPDDEIRRLIRQAVAEWEAQQ